MRLAVAWRFLVHFVLVVDPTATVHAPACMRQPFCCRVWSCFSDRVFLKSFLRSPCVRPVTMETRCFRKKLEFQRYPPKDFFTARYEHKSSERKFQTSQKPRKKLFLDRSLAKVGLRKTQPNVSSKRRDSESWTDIDRQNQRLRHEI